MKVSEYVKEQREQKEGFKSFVTGSESGIGIGIGIGIDIVIGTGIGIGSEVNVGIGVDAVCGRSRGGNKGSRGTEV